MAERSPATPNTRDERRAAAAEIQKAQRSIEILRWAYTLNAFFAFFILARAVNQLRDPSADIDLTLRGIGVISVLFTAFVVGAIQVPFFPLPWAIAIATLSTLARLIPFATGQGLGEPLYLAVLPFVWTGVLWLLVIPAVKTSRLARRHPDLYAARGIQGSQRVSGSRAHGAELAQAGKLRMWKVSISVALGLLALSMFSSYQVYAHGRPPVLDRSLDDFRVAWNASRRDKVEEFFAPSSELSVQTLNQMGTARGWKPALPVIGKATVTSGGSAAAESIFPLGTDTLLVQWVLVDNEWRVSRLLPPAPPTSGVVGAFMLAWNSSNLQALSELARGGQQTEMLQSLEQMAEQRNWNGNLPAIRNPIADSKRTLSKIEFQTDSGFLTAEFELENDTWRLLSIKPPRN